MQVLYYGLQYAKLTENTTLAYQYAQDFICIYDIIKRDWSLRGLTSETADPDEMVNYLNEMLPIAYNCLDILESYYFQSITF